jgi:hypothetical protein
MEDAFAAAACGNADWRQAARTIFTPRLVVRNSREVMGFSKLRRRDFDLSRLRRPLSDACCRAVRSTTGRYDRHSSSSAFGMEAAADPECASRWVDPTNRQGASNPVAGLWSLPFKGKLKVVRTLALAELRARQRIKPYQQLRYWSTVPFRHGPNDVLGHTVSG